MNAKLARWTNGKKVIIMVTASGVNFSFTATEWSKARARGNKGLLGIK